MKVATNNRLNASNGNERLAVEVDSHGISQRLY